jgi:hypothetical protein
LGFRFDIGAVVLNAAEKGPTMPVQATTIMIGVEDIARSKKF